MEDDNNGIGVPNASLEQWLAGLAWVQKEYDCEIESLWTALQAVCSKSGAGLPQTLLACIYLTACGIEQLRIPTPVVTKLIEELMRVKGIAEVLEKKDHETYAN